MRKCCRRRAEVLVFRGTAACIGGWLAIACTAQAQDADPALSQFARPVAVVQRSAPADREAWETLLRPLGQAPAPPRWRSIDEALVDAAQRGQDDDLRKLLQRGAMVDRAGSLGVTALGAAAMAGWRSTVRLLLRAGADPAALGAGGQTALHLTAVAGHMAVVDDMLKLGVPVDLLNRQRETALDVAAAAGQQAVMDRLLQAGADLVGAGRR
jgi:ankyrin repeat protein